MSRIPQVNSLLKKEVARVLQSDVELPLNALVTVSEVDTSPNVSSAKVFVSIIPKNKESEILSLLEKRVYFIQKKVNARLSAMRVPRIRFVVDHREEHAAHIEEIIEHEHRSNQSEKDF